jgi:hypothetical protein
MEAADKMLVTLKIESKESADLIAKQKEFENSQKI